MSKSPKRKPQPILDEEPVFGTLSASLRIFGDNLDTQEIGRTLGLMPTHSHRKGERRAATAEPFREDMWSYDAPIDRRRPLQEQIMALWQAIRPQIHYLRNLKPRCHVDVFCGYQGRDCPAVFKVDHVCLGLFAELEVPLIFSVALL